MLVFKRKQVVVVALAVLIGVAGYLNWEYQKNLDGQVLDVYQQEEGEEAQGDIQMVENTEMEPQESDFFAISRLDREASRSRAQETLNEIISNKDVAKESKEEAEKEIISMSKSIQQEATIESLIKAKGFQEAVIYLTDGKVSALIKSDGLEKQDTAKIQEIIMTQTGISAENIKIVEVK